MNEKQVEKNFKFIIHRRFLFFWHSLAVSMENEKLKSQPKIKCTQKFSHSLISHAHSIWTINYSLYTFRKLFRSLTVSHDMTMRTRRKREHFIIGCLFLLFIVLLFILNNFFSCTWNNEELLKVRKSEGRICQEYFSRTVVQCDENIFFFQGFSIFLFMFVLLLLFLMKVRSSISSCKNFQFQGEKSLKIILYI